ncbi:MAG TPA: alpha/beta hydrolase family protein [Blastocatellia bacterium]|nr:alpha/beta hydrolase family protein [Blastocatellia bacterium]
MRRRKRMAASILAALVLLACAAFNAFPQTPQQPAVASEPHVDYSSLPSAALGRELKFAVLLPPSYEKETKRRYPVLYFLHGMNGSEGEFQRRGVAAAIGKLRDDGKIGEFIVVAPAGQNSFYLNAKNGVRYEDAIIQDLIPFVEKTYRALGTQAGRAIQGLSMGGFGALTLAFKHPEMFSSVTAHSSALLPELPNTSGSDRRSQFIGSLVGNIFGNPPDEAFFRANNPLYLAESNATAIKKSGIKVYFDVGEQDRYGFQGANQIFDERLTKAGIAHEYHMFPGGHGWEYMISVADHSYEFLWRSFKTDGKSQASGRTRAGR